MNESVVQLHQRSQSMTPDNKVRSSLLLLTDGEIKKSKDFKSIKKHSFSQQYIIHIDNTNTSQNNLQPLLKKCSSQFLKQSEKIRRDNKKILDQNKEHNILNSFNTLRRISDTLICSKGNDRYNHSLTERTSYFNTPLRLISQNTPNIEDNLILVLEKNIQNEKEENYFNDFSIMLNSCN
jgi:hypothetical protein